MLLTSTRADEDTIVPALIVWVNVLSIPVASQIFASSTVAETGAVRLLVSNCTRLRSTWPHGRLASAKCAESGQCIVGELDGSPGLFDSCQHNLPAFHQRHGHRFRRRPASTHRLGGCSFHTNYPKTLCLHPRASLLKYSFDALHCVGFARQARHSLRLILILPQISWHFPFSPLEKQVVDLFPEHTRLGTKLLCEPICEHHNLRAQTMASI